MNKASSPIPDIFSPAHNPKGYGTLLDLFRSSVRRFADKPAFSCMGASLSYAELDRMTRDFAAYLRQSGMNPGDRIAIQLPNVLQYPVVVYGALRAGLIVVNVNPLYTQSELLHLFNDSGAKMLVVFANLADAAAAVAPQSGIEKVVVTEIADLHSFGKRHFINTVVRKVKKMVPEFSFSNSVSLRSVLKKGRKSKLVEHKPKADDTAILQYTGGTTGLAKAAELTQSSLLANVLQTSKHLSNSVKEGGELWVAPLPLYHVYAFSLHNLYLFSIGGESLLIPNPRDIPGFVKAISGKPFTAFLGLNTLFVALTENEDFRKTDFSNLRLTASGGMPLTQDAADRWTSVTGCTITEGYGMTEASPVVTLNRVGAEIIGSIGCPLSHTEIKAIDGDGQEVAPGNPGELCIRGPQVMRRYWNRPEETAAVLSDDGWLRTGDVVTADLDGALRIVDRIKDIVIVSGFNVYPVEVDNAASNMPEIKECASIGVPDEKTGEAVVLYVVANDKGLSGEKVREFCRESLTAYKVPRSVVFVDELPKTNVGKVLRRTLKEQHLEEAK